MSKLLSANFSRLWKSKFFIGACILMCLEGVITPVMNYVETIQGGIRNTLDSMFFAYIAIAAIIIPVLCSLYIGTEYSDGTIRNKVVTGNTRISIYLANLIVCVVAVLIITLAYVIPTLCVGIPLLGFFEADIKLVLLKLLCAIVLSLCLTAVFSMIATICSNKTTTAVISILGIFLLLFIGIYISSRLSEPEVYDSYVLTTSDGTVEEKTQINSRYLRGTERTVYEILYDFLPGGQIVQLSSDALPVHMVQMGLYSVVILCAATGAGILVFRRKDIK